MVDDLPTTIARLEAAIDARLAGVEASRVKDGDRETEFALASLPDMRQRLAQLKALQAGAATRVAARRVYF